MTEFFFWRSDRSAFPALGFGDWLALRVLTMACAFAATAAFLAVVPRRRTRLTRLGEGTMYAFLLHGFVIRGAEAAGVYAVPFAQRPAGAAAITVAAAALALALCSAPVRRALPAARRARAAPALPRPRDGAPRRAGAGRAAGDARPRLFDRKLVDGGRRPLAVLAHNRESGVLMWIHSGMEPAPTAHRDPVTTVAVALPGLLIAEAFAQVLRDHELHVVGCYETHAALLDCVRRALPAVAVVDADLLGAAAARRSAALGEAGPETRLVVIAGALDCALAQAIARARRARRDPQVEPDGRRRRHDRAGRARADEPPALRPRGAGRRHPGLTRECVGARC